MMLLLFLRKRGLWVVFLWFVVRAGNWVCRIWKAPALLSFSVSLRCDVTAKRGWEGNYEFTNASPRDQWVWWWRGAGSGGGVGGCYVCGGQKESLGEEECYKEPERVNCLQGSQISVCIILLVVSNHSSDFTICYLLIRTNRSTVLPQAKPNSPQKTQKRAFVKS